MRSVLVAAQAEYYLGRMARLQGDLEEAARLLHRSIQHGPTLPDPHTELGRIALAKGEMEDARLELARALRLSPDH